MVVVLTALPAGRSQNTSFLFDYYENGKVGFMDSLGRIVIVPRFDGTQGFIAGRAGVIVNGKWGFIDTKGNHVVQPQFDGVSDYHDSMALVWNVQWAADNEEADLHRFIEKKNSPNPLFYRMF